MYIIWGYAFSPMTCSRREPTVGICSRAPFYGVPFNSYLDERTISMWGLLLLSLALGGSNGLRWGK